MIIRPHIKTGAVIKKALNYLVARQDSNKKERDIVRVLASSTALTERIFNTKQQSKRPFQSQVLGFNDNDKVDTVTAKEITQRYLELLLNDRNINAFAIQHSNRDLTHNHVHIIFNNVDLDTNMVFNAYPLFNGIKSGKEAQIQFNSAIQRVLAKEFKLTPPPLNKQPNRIKEHNYKLTKHSKNFKSALRKSKTIEKIILEGIKEGEIKNRDDILTTLKEAGLKISRDGRDYFSVDKSSFRNEEIRQNIRFSTTDSNIFSSDKTISTEAILELKELLTTKKETTIEYTDDLYKKDLAFIQAYTEQRDNNNNNNSNLLNLASELKKMTSPGDAREPNTGQPIPEHQKQEKAPIASFNRSKSISDNTNAGSTDFDAPSPGGGDGGGDSGGDIEASINSLMSQIKRAELMYGVNSRQASNLKSQLEKLIQQREQSIKAKEKQQTKTVMGRLSMKTPTRPTPY